MRTKICYRPRFYSNDGRFRDTKRTLLGKWIAGQIIPLWHSTLPLFYFCPFLFSSVFLLTDSFHRPTSNQELIATSRLRAHPGNESCATRSDRSDKE